jgi:hypothetical protein
MYMLNDLALELHRAESAERHSHAAMAASRGERVRRRAGWLRRSHARANQPAAQPPAQQLAQQSRNAPVIARPAGNS